MSPQKDEPITSVARSEFVAVRQSQTVQQALESIRGHEVAERIVYFYVTDDQDRLVGVLPVRRLLMASADTGIDALMVKRLVRVPDTARVSDALELFVLHRLLALPVVDAHGRIKGVVDVGQFTEEVLDFAEKERVDTLFEAMGVRLSELKDAGPLRAWRARFPWLIATMAGGVTCALLAGVFEQALEASVVLSFFLTLVLGLGESVASQSMTFVVQELRGKQPSAAWYIKSVIRECATALLLGLSSGVIAALVVWLWRRDPAAAVVIGGAITASIITAAWMGLTIPALLHRLRLDPRIAAGPLALALADLCTVTIYLGLATIVLLR
ncbi:MAG: magnesium transporter [Planctomycetes bacterium]|jgi:magnesium transporter|nr:magnesium transporter [Planctomycetota bacterium]MCL4730096.1 magnesium transporter [Planctomycetota bacterium]